MASQLSIVTGALAQADLPEDARQLLSACAAASLGEPPHARHAWQTQVVQWIGEALAGIDASLSKRAADELAKFDEAKFDRRATDELAAVRFQEASAASASFKQDPLETFQHLEEHEALAETRIFDECIFGEVERGFCACCLARNCPFRKTGLETTSAAPMPSTPTPAVPTAQMPFEAAKAD